MAISSVERYGILFPKLRERTNERLLESEKKRVGRNYSWRRMGKKRMQGPGGKSVCVEGWKTPRKQGVTRVV